MNPLPKIIIAPNDGELYGVAQIENGVIKIANKENVTYGNVDFVVTMNGELKLGRNLQIR